MSRMKIVRVAAPLMALGRQVYTWQHEKGACPLPAGQHAPQAEDEAQFDSKYFAVFAVDLAADAVTPLYVCMADSGTCSLPFNAVWDAIQHPPVALLKRAARAWVEMHDNLKPPPVKKE